VLASIPKLLLGIPLPAVAVATVLVLQGFVAPLTGAPIFTVITTRTPAALRANVLSAAVGLMFLTGPLGPIAAGPLINAVGARMVLAIAAAGYLVGTAPFAIYVARHRSLGDSVALASDDELPGESITVWPSVQAPDWRRRHAAARGRVNAGYRTTTGTPITVPVPAFGVAGD
jgi:hypothetical protein